VVRCVQQDTGVDDESHSGREGCCVGLLHDCFESLSVRHIYAGMTHIKGWQLQLTGTFGSSPRR